jgi:hypothetical protein
MVVGLAVKLNDNGTALGLTVKLKAVEVTLLQVPTATTE